MDWHNRQGSDTEKFGLSPTNGVKLLGSIIDSDDTTAELFFNESLRVCKRELRNLSQNLQDEAVEILRREARLILNDVCAQVANDCLRNNAYSGESIHKFDVPAWPPPVTVHGNGSLSNSDIIHDDPVRPTSKESNEAPKRRPSITGGPTRQSLRQSRQAQSNAWVQEESIALPRDNSKTGIRSPPPRSTALMLKNLRNGWSAMKDHNENEFKHTRIGSLVVSDAFDYVFGFILVLNAIAMGVQADWEATHLGQEQPVVFAIFDALFCVAFLTELALRLYAFKLAYYFMSGWQWAYFDTVIVSMQAFEEFMKIVELAQNDGGAEKDKGGGVFRVLKLLKVGRLLRMVRMVRLIPELKAMVYLIFASMSAFLWSLVLLSIMIYSIAVYLTMMATDCLVDKGIDATEDLMSVHLYWGSVGDSIMSLYWSITGGQDWGDLIQPLVIETEQQFHNVIFAMYIAFATMVVMNLVTGVFVEGAQRLTKEDKDKEVVKMAYKVFNVVDDDGNIEITSEELDHHMQSGNLDAYLEAINLQPHECLDLFKLLDVDGSGTISLTEFTHGCLKLRGQARAADVAQLLVDVREVKDEVTRRLDLMNGSYKSVLDFMTVWRPFAYDLGCDV